jgi:hypothetical protein
MGKLMAFTVPHWGTETRCCIIEGSHYGINIAAVLCEFVLLDPNWLIIAIFSITVHAYVYERFFAVCRNSD